MRTFTLEPVHFGPFHNSNYDLQPGMQQSMIFSPTDKGPCYMTDEQQVFHRNDINTGKSRTKDLTVSQLISNLKAIGIPDPKGLKPTLQALCTRNNLPLTCTDEVIIEGWVHKPKGAIQILYERGWLNPDLLHLYTGDGRKKDDARVSEHTDPTRCMFSIDQIMKLQKDFTNEVTLLQLHAEKLRVSLDRSPKCHPELAGEGIEYLWALAKLFCQRSPISKKRTKVKFIKLVDDSTSANSVLNIKRAQACSKKARSYMKLYRAFADFRLDGDLINDKHEILEKAMKVYSKMKRMSKTHRSVVDKNLSDVREIEASITLDNERIESGVDGAHSNETMNERIDAMNFGLGQKANVKKEIVTHLIRKMEQM